MLEKIWTNKFVKNVSILASGSVISQLILVAVLPFLTRIYKPEDFEVLALFLAIFSIISVVVCLRFEIAIPIAKDEQSAVYLVLLGIISSVIIVVFISVIIFCFYNQISALTNNKISSYIWLLPITLFFWGGYTSFQYWATRKKQFSRIAKTRLLQSINASIVQILFGTIWVGPLGLLLGYTIQVGSGILSLAIFFIQDTRDKLLNIKIQILKNTFLEYKRFPKYSTWEALSNSAGIQLPIILIASYSLGNEAGYIMLAMKLLSAPMSLIGNSVAQVYLSEAPQYYQIGKLKEFTYKIISTLFKVAIVPMILIAIFSPLLIPIILGSSWERVGILITWMIPWFLLQLIVSPVSMSLHITNHQKIALLLQVSGWLFRTTAIILGIIFTNNFIGEIYAVSSAIFYILYLIVVLKIIDKKNHF